KIGIDVEADLEIKEEDAVEEEEQLSEEIEEEEEKLMEADELDQLGEEMDLPRNEGESDEEYRGRMALHEIEGDLEKCLVAALAKPRKEWDVHEVRLCRVFEEKNVDDRKKFIKDYLKRERVSKENIKIAKTFGVVFPKPCVLNNEMREIMVWFLGSVAPWERDPCLGCSHCPLGKNPEEFVEGDQR
ncbi:MAG: hypothetical protein GX318_02925, partial [Clostridia bacterium]|nr:hypothetical protein [Clostridia bacterium]